MTETLLPTAVVGSYPQPGWLIDRAALIGRAPPRVRAGELWRVPADALEEAQDDASLLALMDMERAGLDVVGDGEARRESYSNFFANALEGLDHDRPGEVPGRSSGSRTPVPRVVGPIRRAAPVEAPHVAKLRAATRRTLKVTLPGPFTMSQQAVDEHYGDPEALAMAYAAAVNAELRDCFAAGADIVQLDEPWMQARPEAAQRFGVKAIDRALEGAAGETAVHVCFGYAYVVKAKAGGYSVLPQFAACAADIVSIEAAEPGLDPGVLDALAGKRVMLGVIALDDPAAESPETVAGRIRAGLAHVPADRLIVAPDCGMKYLPRAAAFAKLQAMVAGAALVRRELAG